MEEELEKQVISSQTPNWLLVVVTILITALVAGGGVFVWQKSVVKRIKAEHQNKVQELEQQIQSLNQEIKRLSELRESKELEAEEKKSEILEDWKTCRLEKFGIQIKYPKNWSDCHQMGHGYIENLLGDYAIHNENRTVLTIGIIKDSEGYNQRLEYIKSGSYPHFSFMSETTLDGCKTILYKDSSLSGDKPDSFKATCILKEENRHIRISGNTEYSQIIDKELFNQILSTFKFID